MLRRRNAKRELPKKPEELTGWRKCPNELRGISMKRTIPDKGGQHAKRMIHTSHAAVQVRCRRFIYQRGRKELIQRSKALKYVRVVSREGCKDSPGM